MTEHLEAALCGCPLDIAFARAETGVPSPCMRLDLRWNFSSQPGVSFGLKNFDATLVPMGRTVPTCFEKITVVSRAEIFVSNESLTNIFSAKTAELSKQDQGFQGGARSCGGHTKRQDRPCYTAPLLR